MKKQDMCNKEFIKPRVTQRQTLLHVITKKGDEKNNSKLLNSLFPNKDRL